MSREKRIKSSTGFYHIMLKGIDDRNIFLDDHDRNTFICVMVSAKDVGDFEIICYSLMNNHVHMLIKEGEQIGQSIKRIAVRYSRYYNKKYERKGHLLNNRYRSEAIEEESYLLNVFHYIHQNPIKAGIVGELAAYKWTSYHDYISFHEDKKTWVDTYLMENYFSDINDFKTKSTHLNEKLVIHTKIHGRLDDDQLYLLIKESMGAFNLNQASKIERSQILRKIKLETGGSNRQLSRVLGIGRKIIDVACQKGK